MLDTKPRADVPTLVKRKTGTNDNSKAASVIVCGCVAETQGWPTVIDRPGSIGHTRKPDEYIEHSQTNACDGFLPPVAIRGDTSRHG